MNASIRDVDPADAKVISALVRTSFQEHVASDWSAAAQDCLLADTSAERLAAPIAESPIVLVHELAAGMLGVILLPRRRLVQLCFVSPAHVGHCIGRTLGEAERARLEDRFPETRPVELNASPRAVAAYRALGFYPISERFARDGAVVTRMACWLPGRALALA